MQTDQPNQTDNQPGPNPNPVVLSIMFKPMDLLRLASLAKTGRRYPYRDGQMPKLWLLATRTFQMLIESKLDAATNGLLLKAATPGSTSQDEDRLAQAINNLEIPEIQIDIPAPMVLLLAQVLTFGLAGMQAPEDARVYAGSIGGLIDTVKDQPDLQEDMQYCRENLAEALRQVIAQLEAKAQPPKPVTPS